MICFKFPALKEEDILLWPMDKFNEYIDYLLPKNTNKEEGQEFENKLKEMNKTISQGKKRN